MWLRYIYNKVSRRIESEPVCFSTRHLKYLIECDVFAGQQETLFFKDAVTGNFARYTFRNQVGQGNKNLELEIFIHHDRKDYKTQVIAEQSWPGSFEVKSILFDNIPERIDNIANVEQVLGHIGGHYVRGIRCGWVPEPHKNRGAFSSVGRFLTGARRKIFGVSDNDAAKSLPPHMPGGWNAR